MTSKEKWNWYLIKEEYEQHVTDKVFQLILTFIKDYGEEIVNNQDIEYMAMLEPNMKDPLIGNKRTKCVLIFDNTN